jgi:hypothetical protein
MAMEDGLSRTFTVIDADIESLDRWGHGFNPRLSRMEKLRTSIHFRLPQVKVRGDVALWNDEGMPWGDREGVTDNIGQCIVCDDTLWGYCAKGTAWFPVGIGGSDSSKVCRVPVPFHGITAIAEGLEITQVIYPTMVFGENVIDL